MNPPSSSSSSSSSSLILDKRPAFLRFTPSSSSSSSSLIVSTYQLDSSSRSGSLLFIDNYSTPSLSTRDIPTNGGVFRFSFLGDDKVIAALTTGRLAIVSIDGSSIHESEPLIDTMLLDISPSPSSSSSTVFTSTNQGSLILFDLSQMETISTWNGHSLPWTNEPCEVWTCEMMTDNVVCSGGEDTVLKIWDTRDTNKPSTQIKLFDAGVTFIESIGDTTLLTGSYDESIRLIDIRSPKNPIKQVKTSGGVWHLEKLSIGWIGSCMYGGWILLDDQFNPIAKNESAGKTLLYGCGISPDGDTLAYCTFNDYTLTVSNKDGDKSWQDLYHFSP